MSLESLGFKPVYRSQLATLPDGVLPARIAVERRGAYELLGGPAPAATIHPKLARSAQSRIDLPAVGDWVGVSTAEDEPRIVCVFERSTEFVRRAAGKRNEPQVVAANVDTVAVVAALTEDADWTARARRAASPRRVERYLVAVRQSGAQPVVLLNKADLCPDPTLVLDAVRNVARDAPVLLVSARAGSGLAALQEMLAPGDTLAFVGSSGVGKSTLINRLMGSTVATTKAVRDEDQRGRHTTSHRELHQLEGGTLLLDTPGMREMGLWGGIDAGGDEAMAEVFDDVVEHAAACRYRDCTHQGEPGCAVREAQAAGDLDGARVDSFVNLQRELSTSREQMLEAKERWQRDIAREVRRMKKRRK